MTLSLAPSKRQRLRRILYRLSRNPFLLPVRDDLDERLHKAADRLSRQREINEARRASEARPIITTGEDEEYYHQRTEQLRREAVSLSIYRGGS